MKKPILIFLAILTQTSAYAMENESSWWRPYIPEWFTTSTPSIIITTPNESKFIADLRLRKTEFENKLRNEKNKKILETEDKMTIQPFSVYNIVIPEMLLQYCYYLKFQNNMFNINLEDLKQKDLSYCFKAQLDGYSVFGASIIAENSSPEEKRRFIQKLFKVGFTEPTPKDMDLATLNLYDAITNKNGLMRLLRPQLHGNGYPLPEDIRKHIVQYVIQAHKQDVWPFS